MACTHVHYLHGFENLWHSLIVTRCKLAMDIKMTSTLIAVTRHGWLLTQYKVIIKCLNLDHGGEYMSKEFSDELTHNVYVQLYFLW